jgi:hypothetical protein
MLLSNQDIATLKRELKRGPKLTRPQRVEYLKQLVRKLSQQSRTVTPYSSVTDVTGRNISPV